MEKRFIIELDPVSGEVSWDNPDGLSFFEIFGAMETVRIGVARALQAEDDN